MPALAAQPIHAIAPHHPVCRGDFVALVFSGPSLDLAGLAGEPTALALYKFALPDPRLDHADDFARTPGMPLPIWPQDRIEPTPGVCFIFADREHPCLLRLQQNGGIEHEHFVISESITDSGTDLQHRLAGFVDDVGENRRITILGYGHQGAAIARLLQQEFALPADRLIVLDSNLDSQARAQADGLQVIIDPAAVLQDNGALIYSPLAKYEGLFAICSEAQRRGLPIYDNRRQAGTLRQFHRCGRVWLDAAALRGLRVDGDAIVAQSHGLPLTCSIVREDLRIFNGVKAPHLHGGHRVALHAPNNSIDVSAPAACDQLARSTFAGLMAAYVSLRDRADLGFFAAREMCIRLWPDASRAIFPSSHVNDLGATQFERLLLGHLHGREIVSTMQTPAQRVALGIAANHYAADRPMIEIGSAFGGSALLLAAATNSHRPPLYSIDPETSTRDVMRFAFQREGHLDRLHQIIKPSDEAIRELAHLKGAIGLVFIDGLHTEAGVGADFEQYSALIARGGGLAFHDVAPQLYSVMKVVLERVLQDWRFEVKCLVDGLMIFERR